MKIIRIEEHGSLWEVPLSVIAKHRAEYYAKKDPDTTFQEEFDHVMNDDYDGIDWLKNNMDWEDFSEHIKYIPKVDSDQPNDWRNAEIDIILPDEL